MVFLSLLHKNVCIYEIELIVLSVRSDLTSAYILGQAYCGLNGGFLLLRIFSVAISVSHYVCFILDIIVISMFLI